MAMQAQVVVPPQSGSFENIKFKIHKRINMPFNSICGCCIMPNGKIAITCDKDKVRVINIDGTQDFEMEMWYNAFDIVATNEDDTYAVTSGCGRQPTITILNLKRRQIKETILMDSHTSGIALRENNLIYSCYEGIRMINPSDPSRSDGIVWNKDTPPDCYVATFEDKIYHSNWEKNTVTCYNLQGKPRWTFQNENVLKTPRGIDVDRDGNVYVVGNSSHNVVVISPDGQRHREILTARDGLKDPTSLHYNGPTKQLLVANFQNIFALFDLYCKH